MKTIKMLPVYFTNKLPEIFEGKLASQVAITDDFGWGVFWVYSSTLKDGCIPCYETQRLNQEVAVRFEDETGGLVVPEDLWDAL